MAGGAEYEVAIVGGRVEPRPAAGAAEGRRAVRRNAGGATRLMVLLEFLSRTR
jgi:hypothetical protein